MRALKGVPAEVLADTFMDLVVAEAAARFGLTDEQRAMGRGPRQHPRGYAFDLSEPAVDGVRERHWMTVGRPNSTACGRW